MPRIYLVIQENTTIAKRLSYVCLSKRRENPYYACANTHICMGTKFTAWNCGLRRPAMGGQLRGECGASSAQVRRKLLELWLAVLVDPV